MLGAPQSSGIEIRSRGISVPRMLVVGESSSPAAIAAAAVPINTNEAVNTMIAVLRLEMNPMCTPQTERGSSYHFAGIVID